jgi:hypothetical protein
MPDKNLLAGTLEHFDLPINPLGEIFKAQKRFGSKFCDFDKADPKNKSKVLKNEGVFTLEQVNEWKETFLDCIEDELSEVRGWTPWKHWKNYKDFEVNVVELRFELIDILHFIISEFLLFGWTERDVFDHFKVETDINTQGSLDSLLFMVKGHQMSRLLCDPSLDRGTQFRETKKNLRNLVKLVGRGYEEPENGLHFKSIMYILFDCFALWGMTGSDVYDYYMSKNKENFARQERGY